MLEIRLPRDAGVRRMVLALLASGSPRPAALPYELFGGCAIAASTTLQCSILVPGNEALTKGPGCSTHPPTSPIVWDEREHVLRNGRCLGHDAVAVVLLAHPPNPSLVVHTVHPDFPKYCTYMLMLLQPLLVLSQQARRYHFRSSKPSNLA